MHVRSLAVCGVAVVCLTGCPSFTTLGMARPLNKNSLQIVLAPEAESVTIDLTAVGLGANQLTVPQGELAVHYGVTDNFELGAKAWFFGASLEGKYGIIRAPTMDSGFDLSIAGSASYLGIGFGTNSVGLAIFSVPVQFGINFGGNQLVLSPKVVDVFFTQAGNVVNVGGSVGIALKLGDELRLMPEVTALYPALSISSSGTTGFTGFNGVILQGGIALMFGGKYESPAPVLPP